MSDLPREPLTETASGARRGMGLAAAVAIGIGGMIGAGIFALMGIASELAGPSTWISFTVAGLIALATAYSFGRLGSRYPSAGGPVEFLVHGLHNEYVVGSLSLLLWMGYTIVNALYARAFGEYFAALAGLQDGSRIWVYVAATVLVIGVTGLNTRGGRSVGRWQLVLVAVKLLILGTFAIGGILAMEWSGLLPRDPASLSSIAYAAGVVFIAYEGFGLITNAAEDMRAPSKNLPRALMASVVVTIVVYAAISIAVTGTLTPDEIARSSAYALAEAARPVFGGIGFALISIAALLATATALNATLYGGANVAYVLAETGRLPYRFRQERWEGASNGLFVTAGLVLVITLTMPIEDIAMAGSLAFLLIYGAVNAAHLRLIDQTGARRSVVIVALIGCVLGAATLVTFIARRSWWLLVVAVGLTTISLALEVYFKNRSPQRQDIETRT